FDLHVLSTPPAFILSQDQTLQFYPLYFKLLRSCYRPALNFFTDQFSKIKKNLPEKLVTICPREDRRNMLEKKPFVKSFF
ncbi:MAG: hypothetical protein NDI81_14775, partial [Desulfobacula sp.]|nr:hypothetical protein [Desulfobacula sp.]